MFWGAIIRKTGVREISLVGVRLGSIVVLRSVKIIVTAVILLDVFSSEDHYKVHPLSAAPDNKIPGMLLCASDKAFTTVEVLIVPEGSKPGDRITTDMFTEAPDPQLNPNKKIFEKVKTDLTTNNSLEVTYKGELLRTSAGPILTSSLVNASVS